MYSQRRILARNLRRLRRQRGWSQEQLAARAGLHRTYVGAVERGERNIGLDNIGRLAWALDVSPAALLSEYDEGVREAGAVYDALPHKCGKLLLIGCRTLARECL